LKDKLLKKYKIINEGELFCSDFKYRFSDEKSTDFMGFIGKSNEETIAEITQELEEIIKFYRGLYKEFLKKITP
jgi:hypothetical protein